MAKHVAVSAYSKYDGDGKTEAPECPRCGPGTFLAQHENRKTCGRCGYAELQK